MTMAEINCPDCGNDMSGLGTTYSCNACESRFDIDFTCQECGSVPEEINSCGSVGYFCNKCKALRSRTSMNKVFNKA